MGLAVATAGYQGIEPPGPPGADPPVQGDPRNPDPVPERAQMLLSVVTIVPVAEDGFPMKLASELKGAANATDSGVFKQPAGPKPALLPGQSATFKVTASPGQKLSFATMFVPSNDAFYGAANGIELFDASGAPASGDVTSQIAAYDAGTEQDQPFYGPATKPVQPSDNFGPSETKPVQPVADAGANTYPPTNKVIRVSINAMPAGGASTGAGGTAGDEQLGEIAAGAGLIVFAGGALALRRRKAVRG